MACAGNGRRTQTLGVVSCHESEGVSTVAAHLAVTAASLAERGVLLLDANFTAPCVPRIFGVPGRPGLAELLQDGGDPAKAIQPSAVDKLSLLVAGRPADSPSRVYGAAGWEGLLKELSAEFELVVVDLPAGDQSSAALQLAGRLDGVLLVVECGRVQRAAAQRFSELLIRAGAHPLGVVLNKWQKDVPEWLSRLP